MKLNWIKKLNLNIFNLSSKIPALTKNFCIFINKLRFLKFLLNKKNKPYFIIFSLLVCFFTIYSLVFKQSILHDYTFSTAVYDKNNKLLRLTLAEDQKYRLFIPLKQISPKIQEATLLYEDQYFYVHFGFNPVSLARATWESYIKKNRMGASTITMQLARILYDIDSTTVNGKLQQILRSIQLEILYSKKEILEAYLNLAPYGYNIEGIGAASLIYFDTQLQKISLQEALSLVVIPQNPASRSPKSNLRNQEFEKYKEILIKQWIVNHKQDSESSLKMPIKFKSIKNLSFEAPHYVNDLMQKNPFESQIYSTLNLKTQKILERILENYISRHEHIGVKNASAMLFNWETNEIESVIGSRDFFDESILGQVNGTASPRSPGSTMKPFIYAYAIEQGLIHPKTMLKDAPTYFGYYSPENFDRGFWGPVIAEDALIYSRNVPAVYLLSKLKEPGFYELLKKSKISALKEKDYYGLALALGGFEISMEEIVKLYAMLRRCPQSLFTDGYLSKESCFLTLKMLSQNPSTNRLPNNLIHKNFDVYWKTGTSYGFKDAWSIGIFGPYVLAVWLGNFDGTPNNAFVGRDLAAPLFFEMLDVLAKENNNFPGYELNTKHLNVKEVEVCSSTGDLPGKFCPHKSKTWFIPGKSPITVENIYRQIPINKKTGKRACSFDPEKTKLEIYEFWPSDLLDLFEQAGFSKKTPPVFEDNCLIQDQSNIGSPPEIILPTPNMVYSIQAKKLMTEEIPFKATLDSDAKEVFWFLDNSYVGKSSRDKTFFWKPKSGHFEIRAVDDLGRSDSSNFHVMLVD